MRTYLYILKLRDDTFYTGVTNNISRRMDEHSKGRGSEYVKGRRPFELVYKRRFPSLSEAMRMERAVKKLPRANKEQLIQGRLRRS